MLTEAITAAKLTADLVVLIGKSKVDQSVAAKAADLNIVILSLTQKAAEILALKETATEENKSLKQQIINLENWDVRAANYELKQIALGTYVYAVKPDSNLPEKGHWLCANCYHSKRESILQWVKHGTHGHIYSCPHCKTEITENGWATTKTT